MRQLLLAAGSVLIGVQTVSAVVVVNLQQTVPGPIAAGSAAEFKLTVFSNTGTINNVAGMDFVIDANDPGFTGTSTAGGRFSAGTNNFFSPNGGYALAFPSSFQVFGANAGTGLTLSNSPTTLATLTLDTTGAAGGTYAMTLSSVLAVDPLFNVIPSISSAPLSYTIVVPEPTSLSLIAGFGLVIRRKR